MAQKPLREWERELEDIYYAVQRRLGEELLKLNAENYSEQSASQIQERTNKLIRRLNREATRWTNTAFPAVYKQGYRVSKARLDILGFRKVPDFYDGTHGQTIEEYIDRTMDDLLKANMSISQNVAMYIYLMRQASKGLAQMQAFSFFDEWAISKLIRQAIEKGEKIGYAFSLIRAYFQKKVGGGNFITIKNRTYTLRYYSRLVGRTRMGNLQFEAVKNTCDQYGDDLVKISDHNTICDICKPYEGNIYSLSGRHPKYPKLDKSLGFHPQCKHRAYPTSEIAIAIEERRKARGEE